MHIGVLTEPLGNKQDKQLLVFWYFYTMEKNEV